MAKTIEETLQERIASLEQQLKERKEKESQVTYKDAAAAAEMEQKTLERLELIKQKKDEIVDSDKIISNLQDDLYKTQVARFNLLQKEYLQLLEKEKLEKGLSEDDKKKLDALKEELIEIGKKIEKTQQEKKLKEEIKNIGNQILEGIKQQTVALDAHIANISKLNGGYAGFGSELREANRQIYQATAGSGVMLEEANAAFAGLSQNFIGLTTQSAASIKSMVVATGQLTKLGVDSASAAKGMDSLVNTMGKTPQQAVKIQESFVNMSAKNRLALGAVSQAFAENSSRFVGYGEQMTKVLDGLAEQSLKTGIAIGKLVGIAQGFDTFEDASKKVGNLNALLGGDYFNSVEMLTASDEERIKLLKEGVAASGTQWESMNRFQKMAIANAAGISDLNEAGKLFGKTSLENTRQQEEAAKVQKTLAEQAESVSTSMDKMKSVLNGVIIALDPLVSLFSLFVDYILLAPLNLAKLINKTSEFGETTKQVITVIGSLGSLALILAAKNLILTRSFGGLGSAIGGATKKLFGWMTGKKAANDIPDIKPQAAAPGPSAAAGPGRFTSFVNNINAGNMLKAAGAILLLAAALLLLGIALKQFADFAGMKENNTSAIGIALGAISGLVAISYALNAAKVSISTGVIVLAIMSASLLLLGIALQSFSKIDWKLVAGVGLIILGLGLAIAGLGMALSGPQAITLAIGIGVIVAIAAALFLMGVALKSIVDAISKASPALSNLGNSFKALFELKDLDKNVASIKSLLSDLADINVEPINNLASAIGLLAENLSNLSSVSANMSLKVGGNAKTVINEQINTTAAVVSAAAATSTTTSDNKQNLIPAAQTMVVPMVVQIDKKTIIEILKEDIKSISRSEARSESLITLETVGITQTAFGVQSLPSRNEQG